MQSRNEVPALQNRNLVFAALGKGSSSHKQETLVETVNWPSLRNLWFPTGQLVFLASLQNLWKVAQGWRT